MQFTLKIVDGQVRQSLKSLGEAVPEVTSRDVREAQLSARDEARTYPPEISPTYQRTGTYYNSFQVEPTDYASWRLTSDASQNGRPYTVYVGGNAEGYGQARVHFVVGDGGPVPRRDCAVTMGRVRAMQSLFLGALTAAGAAGVTFHTEVPDVGELLAARSLAAPVAGRAR